MPVPTRRLIAALLLFVGFLAGATRVTPTVSQAAAPASDSPALYQSIRFGFSQPAANQPEHIVAIVAADIDADGDLDVVASDSALQLHVWVNDGAGHFTLRIPARSSGWQPTPPAPSFDDRSTPAASFTQINPPTLGPGVQAIVGILSAAAAARIPASPSLSAGDWLTRAPRAPPAAPLA